MTQAILIYRDVVLPLSETFIAAPAPMLTQYEAWFTGTRTPGHDLVDPARVIDPDLPLWRRALFKATGSVPAEWLEKLRARNPALLHAHFGTDGVFASPLARRLGIPMIVTFHGFDATVNRALGPVWTVYKQKRAKLFHRADRILAVSKFIESRLLASGCPAENIETHYLGVDTEHFRPANTPRERIVLFAGRLIEKKGCADLIDAMGRVQAQAPDVRLVIIGDGPLRAELEPRAADLRAVTFLGACAPEEVRRQLQRTSLFALPSRTARSGESEGLPIVILEAQSMEVPVVSTLHAGIPEAVVHEETGLLGAEGDIDALADNILRLMRNDELRRSMGIAARQRMVASFDLRKQTARLETIYDRVIAAKRFKPNL